MDDPQSEHRGDPEFAAFLERLRKTTTALEAALQESARLAAWPARARRQRASRRRRVLTATSP
jgi:hypothetical protein